MAVRNSINTSVTAHGVQVANSAATGYNSTTLSNGQVLLGSTGAAPVAANLTAGAGISITNAAGSCSIAATGGGTGGGFTWNVIDGAITPNTTGVPGNGYIVSNVATIDLPATFAVGDMIWVVSIDTSNWYIQAASGDIIQCADVVTSAGGTLQFIPSVAGSVSALLLAIEANSKWALVASPCLATDAAFAMVIT